MSRLNANMWGRLRADDEVLDIPDVAGEGSDTVVVDGIYDALAEDAVSAQRLGVCRNATEYVKGKMESAVSVAGRTMTDEKMFRVTGLIDWLSGMPDVVIEAMQGGRLRARLSAKMGLGKSTVLPYYIADKMGHRVLYLSLEVGAVVQGNRYMKQRGQPGYYANWRSTPGPHVTCMTYHDFNSSMAMGSRAELLQHFETVIFDEAFVEAPEVRAAKKIFAVVATPTINLLLCSANIRDDVGAESSSEGMGKVKHLSVSVSPEEAMASGKLVGDYLVDRTLVILPSDERVHDMASHYEEYGVDVITLDSASRDAENEAAERFLMGDSSTPRVIVAHAKYGICYNFGVNFVILWPLVSKVVVGVDTITHEEVPMSEAMVGQALARAGRGIVREAGAMVMSPDRAESDELSETEKFLEFVYLARAYIKARHTPEWAKVYEKLPSGMSAAVAHTITKVNLPPEVALRYIAADGLFAAKYVAGLQFFSQPDQFLPSSKHMFPVAHDAWFEEQVFGSPEGTDAKIKVPFKACGELQVIMHSIVAISSGDISVKKWRMDLVGRFNVYRGERGMEPTRDLQKRRMRRVRSFEFKQLPPVPEVKSLGWTYESAALNSEIGGRGSRDAVEIDPGRFKEAILGMRATVEHYAPATLQFTFMEGSTGGVGGFELAHGDIESPGGTAICEIPGNIAQELNAGCVMSVPSFKYVLGLYRTHKSRFTASRLFDCYGAPWTSVLLTFLSEEIVGDIIRSGLASHAYEFLGSLNSRFSVELIATVKQSNVFKKRFLGIFVVTPTTDEVMRAVRAGKFDNIAQSQGYIDRVKMLKRWIDESLILAESLNVYLPYHITEAQRTLPIHANTSVGHVGHGGMISSESVVSGSSSRGSPLRVMTYSNNGHARNGSGGW